MGMTSWLALVYQVGRGVLMGRERAGMDPATPEAAVFLWTQAELSLVPGKRF